MIIRAMFRAILREMRPRQWTKNAFVLAAVVFDRQLTNPIAVLRSIVALVLFSLLASAVYIFNDLADVEADRQHPVKRNRPIASGALSPQVAATAGTVFLAVALLGGFLLSPGFLAIELAYVVVNALYSRWLKRVPILDVLIVALGFVLRVGAGVEAIHVSAFSPWLYMVTTLLALYLALGKRRAELSLLEGNAGAHRAVLDGYTLPLLDQLITIVSGTTIIAYSLYTFSAPDLPGDHSMMLTVPFVLYGIFRYLYLMQVNHSGGEPEEVILRDRPLQVAVLLWVISVLVIFYGV